MKKFVIFCLCAVALVFLLFLVPDYSASEILPTEMGATARLNESGERLLLRTETHDYEFALPTNHLTDVAAYASASAGDGIWDVGTLRVSSAGQTTMDLDGRFGGYDPRQSEVKTVLSDGDRARLRELGLMPSNANHVGEFDPPLFMVWHAHLQGQQFPRNSRGQFTGAELNIAYASDIEVRLDDPVALRHAQTIEAMLSPLVALRDDVRNGLLFVIVFFGGNIGLPRG